MLRRPIVFIAAAFAGGIGFGVLINIQIILQWFLVVVATICLFGSLILKKQNKTFRICCFFVVICLLGSVHFQLQNAKKDPLEGYVGKLVTVEGFVTAVEKKEEDSYKFTVIVDKLVGETQISGKSKIFVSVYGDLLEENPHHTNTDLPKYSDVAGRRISIRGELSLPQERRNPRTFDYRFYLKSKGICVVMTAKPHQIEMIPGEVKEVTNYLSKVKYQFIEKLYTVMPAEMAGLAAGMMFGDKNGIDDDLYENFQCNGSAHILAVSGLHVGIVYLYINKLIGGRRNVFFDCIAICLLLCYAAMAAFSPSVIRAVSMIVLHIISKLLYCRYDMLSAAAFTALVSLIINPIVLFNPGFQLSYLAIVSLAVMLPILNGRVPVVLVPVLAVQIGMVPLTAYLFNYFSLGAFLVNIPIILLAGIIIPLGMLLFPLIFLSFGFGELLYGVVATGMEVVCRLMVFSNELIYMEGSLSYNVTSPNLFILCCYYGMLFFFCCEWGRVMRLRKQWKRIGAALCIIILTAATINIAAAEEFDRAHLVFVDVGQGDCLHIKTAGGKNILIDGGGSVNYDVGKKILMPYLLKNGVKKIDFAIVTHLHTDHYGGIVSLSQNKMVEKLGLYEGNRVIEKDVLEETGLDVSAIVYLKQGQKIQIDEGTWIEILYPEGKSEEEYGRIMQGNTDENASSLIMKVYAGNVSVLMTGDVDTKGEKKLIELYDDETVLQSNILKAGHHGSRYSTGDLFLERVSPSVIVFQVGKNNFGHPHESIIAKCEINSIILYRNDLQGAVGVFLSEDGIAICKPFITHP